MLENEKLNETQEELKQEEQSQEDLKQEELQSQEDLKQEEQSQENSNDTQTNLNEEQLLVKMQDLLNKNASWLEQVKMSLLAIYHLHKSHKDVKDKYEFVLSECIRIKEELDISVFDFKSLIDMDKKEFIKIKDSMKTLNDEYDLKLEEFNELIENFENIHQIVQNTLNTMEEKLQEGKNIHALISAMYEELKKYDAKEIINEANRVLEELKQNSEDLILKILQVKNESLSEITELKENSTNEITELKENSTNEITELKNQSLSEITELKENSTNEITELKENSTNEITELKNESLSEITELKENSLNALNETKNESLTQIEQAKIEQEQILTEFRQSAILQDEKITSLEVAKESIITDLTLKTKLLTQNLEWTIGSGGDFEDLQSAIDEAGKYISSNYRIIFKVINDLTINNPINNNSTISIIITGVNTNVKLNINIKENNFINCINNVSNALFIIKDITINSINCYALFNSSFFSAIQLRYINVSGNFKNLALSAFGGVIYVIGCNINSTNNLTDDAIFDACFNANIILHGANTINNGNVLINSSYGAKVTSGWNGLVAKGRFNKGLVVSNHGIIQNSYIILNQANFSKQKYSQTPGQWTSNGYISTNL